MLDRTRLIHDLDLNYRLSVGAGEGKGSFAAFQGFKLFGFCHLYNFGIAGNNLGVPAYLGIIESVGGAFLEGCFVMGNNILYINLELKAESCAIDLRLDCGSANLFGGNHALGGD